MSSNIIISGLAETNDETEDVLKQTIIELFSGVMRIKTSPIIIICHRLRKNEKSDYPRNVVVRLSSKREVHDILANGKYLKGHKPAIYINQQFPVEVANRRRILLPVFRKARELKLQASLKADTLIVDGIKYNTENVHLVPFDMSPIHTKEGPSSVIFKGRFSPLSNFNQSKITIDGTIYNSIEHCYQYQKALAAKDHQAANEILTATDPAEAKKVGDTVKTPYRWKTTGLTILEDAIRAKFKHNPDLRR